ncbi:MAG: hypothetical protein NT062_18505 [Proteobacteria bacterium]|nr:hypothetical protein [Pseudomonadota bacterium]
MADDDRELMERLAALEAEVKADATVSARAQAVAAQRMREARAERLAEHALAVKDAVKDAPAAASTARPAAKPTARAQVLEPERDRDDGDELGNALALARRANSVKQELTRAPTQGEKSWIKSGLASLLLGPLGWLYAGSWREAVPASAGWLAIGALASKIIPMFLLMPVMMVVLPLSGIAGIMYALRFNKAGKRQRLFGPSKEQLAAKQLESAAAKAPKTAAKTPPAKKRR